MIVQIKKPYRYAFNKKNILNRISENKKIGVLSALQSIQNWLCKEMKSPENLPKEFKDFLPVSQQDHFKHHWHRFL